MLFAVLRGRFSKTARSHPRHGEAGWGVDDLAAFAIVSRVHADDVAKGATECAETGKPDVKADVGDAALGFAQQEHGPLDAPPLQVPVRSLAKGRPKRANEVRLRNARHARQRPNVERLGVGAIDRIAGAQHPAVQLFDGACHTSILPCDGNRSSPPATPPSVFRPSAVW